MFRAHVFTASRISIVLFVLLLAGNGIAENLTESGNGRFIVIQQTRSGDVRAFVAGPESARAAVLVVHDYFGISTATQKSVEHLGALGYRALAVDLYGGRSATNHEEALKLMRGLDRANTDTILQAGLNYLKRPGRKLATIGFSMGGIEALNANLNDPDDVSATVMIYGSGYDTIELARLQRIRGAVLVITGSEDAGAADAGVHFLSVMKQAKRSYELVVYPDVDHGYAQPLFNEGKNYNADAVHATWVVVDDFLGKTFQ